VFSPSSGTVADKYSFEITYTDQDNDAPQANGVYAMVGDTKIILKPETAVSGSDYKTGVKYSAHDQALAEGDYRVVFMASDVRSLGANAISAGNLTVGPDTSADKPTNLLVIAAILIVVIVLLIIGITIFLFRRKAKKDKAEIEKIIAPTQAKVSEVMCTGCGSTLPEGTVKCPKCGRDLKKVEEKISKTFKCPTCGGSNPEGATRCIVCKKDFTAVVHDTTKMAGASPPPVAIPPEGQTAQSLAEEPEEQVIEGNGIKDVSKLSDNEFDDGMNFEGFDEA